MEGIMKARAIEAMDVIRAIPGYVGPGGANGYWPEHLRDYADNDAKPKFRPSADQIARCDQFTTWVSRLDTAKERENVWQWAFIKAVHSKTVRGHCINCGLKEHEYRRQISSIFQKLARISGIKQEMRPNADVDAIIIQSEKAPSSEKSRTHWMDETAKPVHDPDCDSHKALIKRLLKKQQNRVGA